MIQQNVNGSRIFSRSWEEFKVGFSDSRGNYWLGNDLLSQLTRSGRYKLRFDLQSRSNTSNWYYAEYSTFIVQPESSNYRLEVYGYSGNAGRDSLSEQNGAMFSTLDRDNDQKSSEQCCTAARSGGFWYGYRNCCYCCVNRYYNGFQWLGLPGGRLLQSSRMWLQCN